MGCGDGKFTADFLRDVAFVLGVDASPSMIESAKQDYGSTKAEFRVVDCRYMERDAEVVNENWDKVLVLRCDPRDITHANMLVGSPTLHCIGFSGMRLLVFKPCKQFMIPSNPTEPLSLKWEAMEMSQRCTLPYSRPSSIKAGNR